MGYLIQKSKRAPIHIKELYDGTIHKFSSNSHDIFPRVYVAPQTVFFPRKFTLTSPNLQ